MGRSRYVIGIDPPESLAQTDMIICDTNILIEFYKGNHQVVDILRGIGIPNLAISVGIFSDYTN